MKIYHLNCGILHAPPGPPASCHCMLVEHGGRVVLLDTGIGLQDISNPLERVGQPAIEAAGFQFHEPLTAARQLESLGYQVSDLSDIVLTHGDPDHSGGLADFPTARVHISKEEHSQIGSGHWRYSSAQFSHGPQWVTHSSSSERWFGLEARPLNLFPGHETFLVPLFGHTLGHCGVAIQEKDQWLFFIGDAYYLRVELSTDDHPVSLLTAQRADDDHQRRVSLTDLRRLTRDHATDIEMFGYHDFTEFPSGKGIQANGNKNQPR